MARDVYNNRIGENMEQECAVEIVTIDGKKHYAFLESNDSAVLLFMKFEDDIKKKKEMIEFHTLYRIMTNKVVSIRVVGRYINMLERDCIQNQIGRPKGDASVRN